MTTKADFTDEEWARLERAPFVAGMAISLADPGGPIEAVKETAATLKTVVSAAEKGGRGELVDAIARRRAGGRERCEGRRLHGLQRRAGERGRAADAGSARRSTRGASA